METPKKIEIVEVDPKSPSFDEVEKTIRRVFGSMSFSERMSFWAYRHKESYFVKKLMRLFGVASLLNVWVAKNQYGEICGTTGLYTCCKDEKEAMWLSWFCVPSSKRGKGIGKKLLEFSIEKAREHSKAYLRLYTTTDPNEAAAQVLYENYGFTKIKERKHLNWVKIERELKL